jgi:hypothetical protein
VNTYRKTIAQQTYFVIVDAEPALHETIRGLYYREFEDGFAKAFPADTPHLDQIYANFARFMPDLSRQSAGLQPVPWETALEALLQRLQGHGLNWWLVGSAALAVRGLQVTPHDLDLVVQDQGSHRVSELLRAYEVEPMSDSRGWIWDWFGRGFLHARVEWVGDVNAKAETDGPTDFGPTALERSEMVEWRGFPIRVPPLDLQLIVSERRGLTERANLIRSRL